MLDTCRAALGHFKTIGCAVEEVTPAFDFEQMWRAWIDLRSFMVAGANAALYRDPARRALLKPEALWKIERGLALSAMAVYDAAKVAAPGTRPCASCLRRSTSWCAATQVFPLMRADWPHQIAGRDMDTYHRWMQAVVRPPAGRLRVGARRVQCAGLAGHPDPGARASRPCAAANRPCLRPGQRLRARAQPPAGCRAPLMSVTE